MLLKAAFFGFVGLLTLVGSAVADDWVVVKLRGVALQQVDGAWINLERGGVVSDDRTIRTLANARLELQRDEEILELGPDTQISIVDRQGERFTTVTQSFGELVVDAEARNVEHFAVHTPYLAAVVKGTRFTVTTGSQGASIKVSRGEVAVEDVAAHLSAIVTAGQSASSGADQPLVVLSANGDVISGMLEGAVGDVVDDVLGDEGVVGDVLDGVGDALGGGSSGNNNGHDDQGSGGLGVDLNVLGLGSRL